MKANDIRAQLGYRVRVVPKRGAERKTRDMRMEVRESSNGRMVTDFDSFMSSVRFIHVAHPRAITAKLVEAAKKVGKAL